MSEETYFLNNNKNSTTKVVSISFFLEFKTCSKKKKEFKT